MDTIAMNANMWFKNWFRRGVERQHRVHAVHRKGYFHSGSKQ